MTGRIRRGPPRIICIVTALATVASCAREVPYASPAFPFMKSYASRNSTVPVLLNNAAWWKAFRDPVLDTLVARAMQGSLTLAIAKERVREAQANVAAVPDAVSATADVSLRREGRDGGPHDTKTRTTVNLSWLLDPWGARRGQVKAARARVEVADAEADAAQLLLLLNISNAYVDLRYQQRLLTVRQQELRARRRTLDLTQTLFEQNSATRLDLIRAEARLAETEATIPGIRAAIQSQKYQIAVLLGMAPGTLDINLDTTDRQPQANLSPEMGIPADLLRNRPDIRIAERLYYVSVAEVGSAEADLYPQLSLGGTISLGALSGNVGPDYFFGPTLQLPALPGSSRRAVVKARRSQARQAHDSWKSTVLDAILEVESALLGYAGASASVQSAQRAVRLYREAVGMTQELIAQNGATIRELIDADEAVADAELTLAANQRQLGRSFVALNVSLGSGNAHAKEPVVAAASQ